MRTGARYHRQAAFNYAEALMNLARRKGLDLSALAGQAAALREAIQHNRARLRRFLDGPQFPTEAKLSLVRKVLGGQADDLIVNLFCLLVNRDRTDLAPDILEIFADMVASAQGIHYGRVWTAAPLDSAQKSQMLGALERFTQKQLRIQYAIDPEVLGGVVFQFKDLLIDSSVQGRLAQLRQRLESVRVV